MKAIIIDDEAGGREYLSQALARVCPNVQLLGMAENADQGYLLIRESQPDLVFLDVEMPNGSGFDLLRRFENINFELIFVTGFDKYALNAIKFNCLDFLLKPYSFEDLAKAVEKAKIKHQEKDLKSHMANLLFNLQQNKSELLKIPLPTSEGFEFVEIKSIIHLEADGKYTRFHCAGGKSLFISRSLKDYQGMFEEHGFFRIHHKHLINLNKIKKYHKGEGGYVVMTNEANLDVSRKKKKEFLQRLSQGGTR